MSMKLGMLGMHHTHAHGIVKQVAAYPDEFSLVGFYDPEPEVVEQRTADWSPLLPSFRMLESPDALLAEPLDGVVVEGRVWQNVEWARMAVEKGFPVLLEKPGGPDMDGFRGLADLAQERGVYIQMLYLFRYMSAVAEMRERAQRGEFGQVYAFRARLPKELELYDENVDLYGWHPGGIFFEMAGHIVDMMVTLMGAPRNVTPFIAHHHSSKGTFADNGVGLFECDQGWGILEVPALEIAPRMRRIEVYGTEGAFTIPNLGSGHLKNDSVQAFEVFRTGMDDWQRHEPKAAMLQIADLREFAACVSGKKEPNFSLEHDLAVHEALLRASGVL